MPRSTAINPKTGKRYDWEAAQVAKKADAQEQAALQAQIGLLKRQQRAIEARSSLLTYTRFTMPDPADPNDIDRSAYEATKVHRVMAATIDAFLDDKLLLENGDVCDYLIVSMPPRVGKTELCTKRTTARYLGRHPTHHVAVAAYSDGLAQEFGGDTRAIMSTPQHRQVFPNFKLRRGGNAKDNLETVQGGRALFVGRGGALTGRGANCFVSGTEVLSKDGSRQIQSLRVGDEVLSFENGKLCWRRVQALSRREGARIFRITTAAGRVVEATGDHPFYVDGEWIEAASLASGDPLLCAVRVEHGAPVVRRGETRAPGAYRVLLQRLVHRARVELEAVRGTGVPSLWRAGAKALVGRNASTRADLLLARVHGGGARRGIRAARALAHETVRALQRYVRPGEFEHPLLLPAVRIAGPCGEHAEREQPALEGRGVGQSRQTACHEALPRTSAHGHGAGRAALRAVRDWWRERGAEARGASHRREPIEQPGVELDYALPDVSRNGAFFAREGDAVRSVEDTGRHSTVYDIQVEGAHCFFANGVLAHNCLIVDDLYKDHEEARSDAYREQTWNWFTKVAMTRLMKRKMEDGRWSNAKVLIVMTRWHSDDIIGRITDPANDKYIGRDEASKWKIIRLPAFAEEDDPLGRKPGEVLWPERFDEARLRSQQRLDPLGFEALYQQRPTVADGILFRRETIRYYDQLPDELRFYASSDHAVGTKQRNDPSCFLKIGIDRHDNIYLIECIWKRMPTDEAVEAMLAMAGGNMRPLLWWAERGHISKSIGPFLRKRMLETRTYINIVEVTPAVDKEQRAQSIAARVAMGKVLFPKHATWTEKAIGEMLAFPNGNHDDFVDALAYIGLGLQSQFAPARADASPDKRAQPQFGTLAWVKWASALQDRQRELDTAGGF